MWAALVLTIVMALPNQFMMETRWVEVQGAKCGQMVAMGPVKMSADRVTLGRWKAGHKHWKVVKWECRQGLES